MRAVLRLSIRGNDENRYDFYASTGMARPRATLILPMNREIGSRAPLVTRMRALLAISHTDSMLGRFGRAHGLTIYLPSREWGNLFFQDKKYSE